MELTKPPKHETPTYSASYKAEELDWESRNILLDYNKAKQNANAWLDSQGIPLLISFKPTEKGDGIWSHMVIRVSYMMPNKAKYQIGGKNTKSWNQLRLEADWRIIARQALEKWDTHPYQKEILKLANKLERSQEAEDAYERAY